MFESDTNIDMWTFKKAGNKILADNFFRINTKQTIMMLICVFTA